MAKTEELFARVQAIVEAGGVSAEQAGTILGDAERALKRAAKRAGQPDGYERVEIIPTRGPRLEFTGRLLAEEQWTGRGHDAIRAHIEIWETKGGALVATDETVRVGSHEEPRLRAAVVEPGDDSQAMRFAVMDFFDWSNRARNLAKKLGWSLRIDVE
jgi:hypothetical protein